MCTVLVLKWNPVVQGDLPFWHCFHGTSEVQQKDRCCCLWILHQVLPYLQFLPACLLYFQLQGCHQDSVVAMAAHLYHLVEEQTCTSCHGWYLTQAGSLRSCNNCCLYGEVHLICHVHRTHRQIDVDTCQSCEFCQ